MIVEQSNPSERQDKSIPATLNGISLTKYLESSSYHLKIFRISCNGRDDLLVHCSELPLYVSTEESFNDKVIQDSYGFDSDGTMLYHKHRTFPMNQWDIKNDLPWDRDKSLEGLVKKGEIIKRMLQDVKNLAPSINHHPITGRLRDNSLHEKE